MLELPPTRNALTTACWLAIAFVVAASGPVRAQDEGVSTRVTYVAGSNVYVPIGRDVGIVPGDTLRLILSDGQTQPVVVRSAMRDRSVLELADGHVAVSTGDVVKLASTSGLPLLGLKDEPEDDAVTETTPDETEAGPNPPVTRSTRAARSKPPRLDGRVMAGFSGLRSQTKALVGSPIETTRTFMTPWAALQFQVRDLPMDLYFQTRLRADYRYSTRDITSPDFLFRAYEAYIERESSSATIRFGRFSNRYTISGGYWDGLLLEYGPGDTGAGVSAGYLPERSNGSINFETPKFAVYGRTQHRIGQLNQSIYGWYQEIFLSDARPTRHNVGLNHRANLPGVTSDNRIELDRDPESGKWMLTRGSFQLAGLVGRAVHVRGRYEVRQPYSMYRPISVISYRRDQTTIGATVQGRAWSFGADYVWNFVYRSTNGREADGNSLRLYAASAVSRSLRLNATASYWTSTAGKSSLLSIGAARSMNWLYARLNYQFSRSTRFDTNVSTHVVSTGLSMPISRRIRTAVDVRFQGGSNLSSVAFNGNLTVTL